MADRWNVIEDEMLPTSLDELAGLRTRLLERGYSRALVAGCLEFLVGKARGEEVQMSPQSKTQYRKMLTALRRAPDRPPDETGGATIVALAAVAGVVGTVLAVAGHPHLLAVAPPIIQDSVNPQDELSELSNYCCEPPLLLAA